LCKKEKKGENVIEKQDESKASKAVKGVANAGIATSVAATPIVIKTAKDLKKAQNTAKAMKAYAIAMKFLQGVKWFFIGIGLILALITFLAFIYIFLVIFGIVEPDPTAFFARFGF